MMRLKSVLLAPCAVASASVLLPGERDWTGYTYEQFVAEFNKNYGADEQLTRKATFDANLALINNHNSDASKTWFATVNEFSDWTNEEFRQKRAHGTRSHTMPDVPVLNVEYGTEAPKDLDWRKKDGVVTSVKNQGACGSCWAFSATETLESHAAISAKKPAPELAPQQIVDCAPNPKHCGGTGGCEGATQEVAFAYTKTIGLTTEDKYHYTEQDGTCKTNSIKPVVKNTGFVRLPTNNYTSLVNAVANVGPIAISVAAGASGWQLYGGGVYSGDCGYDQDHAVQLVGYGTDKGKDYWLVRNSWGAEWGETGYIRIARYGEGKEPCGMDQKPQDGSACEGQTKPEKLCGLCGILSDSSYPTGVTYDGPAPGPSPGPGPSPSPSPFSKPCSDAMSNYCGNAKSAGSPSICRGCCSAHQSELEAATCTAGDWDSWCEPSDVITV